LLPDVALYAVKAQFSKGDALPDYKFKAVKIAVTNPPHPQYVLFQKPVISLNSSLGSKLIWLSLTIIYTQLLVHIAI
jgi:hypothetical protein